MAIVTGVLVLTAMPLEARGLARRLGLHRVSTSRWTHYRSDRVELAAVGLGAARLGERSPHLRAPSLIVSSGTCGALASHLAAGDLVVPDCVIDGRRTQVTAPVPPLTRRGSLVSAPAVVSAPADKWRLGSMTGALAVDLESAAILDWARALGVPAAVVRGVSDTADTPVPEELLALVTADGTVRSGAALRVIARQPRLLRRALALARGASAALDAVGRALRAVADAHLDTSRRSDARTSDSRTENASPTGDTDAPRRPG